MEPERNADDPVMAPIAYEFGDFRVDLRTMSLSKQGQIVPVEPKVFDVLCRLIEHRDRVLTKDELLDLVWPGTFVTPNALTRAVAQLRKALGDDAGEATLIATVSKRGYRWVAPVTVVDRAASANTPVAAPEAPPSPAIRWRLRRPRVAPGRCSRGRPHTGCRRVGVETPRHDTRLPPRAPSRRQRD